MSWSDRRRRFRAALSGAACSHFASVYDPLTARMAEDLGFETGMLSGSVAALMVLGAPDITLTTLTEVAAQAYRIGRASALPLLVDADHGFGNALNVMRTVQELEAAGVAAATIEDTVLPRTFGEMKPGLLPLAEAVGKLKAAVAARSDRDFVVVARTSTALAGLDDALVRLRAYQEAGVDALFVAGLGRRAELDAIAEVAKLPLIVAGASAEIMDRDYLYGRGVKLALPGFQPLLAGLQATYAAFKTLRDGAAPSSVPNQMTQDRLNRLMRADDYAAWTKAYLG